MPLTEPSQSCMLHLPTPQGVGGREGFSNAVGRVPIMSEPPADIPVTVPLKFVALRHQVPATLVAVQSVRTCFTGSELHGFLPD